MDTREIEAKLAKEYGYKKLTSDLSYRMRMVYRLNLPDSLKITGDNCSLYSANRSLICTGYDRIVIGDYGAFIEFDSIKAALSNFIIKPGQEYRVFDPKYSSNIKYQWYTINDGSDIKIYHQVRGVSYADYIPGKYYVSPHEVRM